ncbi:hypothetical protein EDD80_102159 [Anseongella ginsenosidimutans]|uniref:CBU-0592-like domain-containing protein n=1 Tax=Anseongella ginsenosidimutans TaxID=496056 RepID=A0A4R3KUZ4_9SPHI|nr:hypothetical protein [Anseongella ginsenosidimutans]TCS88968.1 hypothetical protein EDD80_102159 [Anseongella ginsenosidimutans]
MTLVIIGWVGAAMYILAYLLLTLGKLRSDSILYHFLNVLGAVGLIANAFHFNDYPNVVTNLLWLGIGCFAIFAIIAGSRKRKAGNRRNGGQLPGGAPPH